MLRELLRKFFYWLYGLVPSLREIDVYVMYASLFIVFYLNPNALDQYAPYTLFCGSTFLLLYIFVPVAAIMSIIFVFTKWLPHPGNASFIGGTAVLIMVIASYLAAMGWMGSLSQSPFILERALIVFPLFALIRAAFLFLALGAKDMDLVAKRFVYSNTRIFDAVMATLLIVLIALLGMKLGIPPLITYLIMIDSTLLIPRPKKAENKAKKA